MAQASNRREFLKQLSSFSAVLATGSWLSGFGYAQTTGPARVVINQARSQPDMDRRLLGAFLIRYWTTRIRFFYMVGIFWRGTFDAPAWVMLPLWFGMQLFYANLNADAEGGGVAYWAHIGGFLAGVALVFVFRSPKLVAAHERATGARRVMPRVGWP